jgi:hypothetical protein
MKKLIKSENFNTTEEQFFNRGDKEKLIRSEWFINREGRKLLSHLGYEDKDEKRQFAASLLHDFAATLKAIVKEELLEEMRNRIENIDTFYR